MLGNFVLSSGYYDAYFTKAQKVRKLTEATEQMLKENDILLFPTTPLHSKYEINDPIQMYLQDILRFMQT